MKKINFIIIIAILLFAACKKEVSNVSTLSAVAYPTITLKGQAIISTSTGGSYTDPGAKGWDNLTGDSIALTPTSNTVDLSAAGFYTVNYEFRNVKGFRANATRFVLVTPVSPSVDISGTYARASNGQVVHLTKVGTGLYFTDNVGGVVGDSSFIFPVYIGQLSDSTIQIPPQDTPLGTLYADYGAAGPLGKLSISPADTTFSYVVENPYFGTSVRVFSHQ